MTSVLRLLPLLASLAAGSASATSLGANLIVNGDAEAGLSGWTAFESTALFGAVEYGPNWVQTTQPGPVDRGSYLFVGDGGNAYAAGWQTVSIADLAPLVDAGQARYSLSGWLGGWTSQNDNAVLYVEFLGVGGVLLGSAQLGPVMPADRNSQTGLVLRDTAGVLPVGTSSLSFALSMERFSGGDNDGYADNLAFSISAVPEPQSLSLMLAGMLAVGAMLRRQRG